MCYRTIKGILGSCESLCLLFSMLFNFWKKFKSYVFDIFFLDGFFRCGTVVGRFEIVLGRLKIVVDRCGSLWDRCGSLWIVVDRCGSLWIVVGRCGSLWVVPGFSNYALDR